MNKQKLFIGIATIGFVGSVTAGLGYGYNLNNTIKEQAKQINTLETTVADYDIALKEQKGMVSNLDEEIKSLKDRNASLETKLSKTQGDLKKARSVASQIPSRGTPRYEVGSYNIYSKVNNKSNVTAAQLNKAFEGTGLSGLGQAYVNAEQKYGINAVFLAAISVEESGWGSSKWAKSNNNLFGIDSGARYFSSKSAAIDYTAGLLANNYLKTDGKYYNGPTPAGVNVKYCVGTQWRYNITSCMNTIVKRINS